MLIKVVIAEPRYLVRMGLKHILQRNKSLQIVGECENTGELVSALKVHYPDVVLMDYNGSNQINIEDITRIKSVSPLTSVMIISEDRSKTNIHKVLDLGASGFITKECSKEEINNAILAASRSEKFFCNKILDVILEKDQEEQDENCDYTDLTPREVEIVKMVTEGLSAKEISEELSISTHTVYTHRKNIMKKLGIKNSSELVLYAVNTGLVPVTT